MTAIYLIQKTKPTRAVSYLFGLVIVMCTSQTTICQQREIPDTDFYDQRFWKESVLPDACHDYHFKPDTSLFNRMTFYGDLPMFGYPFHQCLRVGLNDTLNAEVTLYNVTGKDFILAGKDCEHWFAPQVYQMYVKSPGGPAFRDSTQLGYRMRGWSYGRDMIPDVDTLRPEDGGKVGIKMDIWNLPEGHYQVCLEPTEKVPAEFNAHPWGYVFECYTARDLADSCNAYEACFWRADEDSNFSSAKDWVGKILDLNPSSVPGWWLKAFNAVRLGDTDEAKSAFDKAIDFLNTGADPAMPDSTERPLAEIEKLYIRWLQRWLPLNRAQLGP